MEHERKVFVFHGADSSYANAVFSSYENAEAWIRQYGLTGGGQHHSGHVPGW
jgi:hypothetical protein